MIKSINFRHFGAMTLLFILAFFSSCQKETVDNLTNKTTSNAQLSQAARNINNSGHVGIRGGGENGDDCGCYSAFDGIDWEASEDEIIIQIEAILDQMTNEEVEALLTPVCTPDGEIYDNACIAECEGVTDFAACTDEDFDEIFGGWDDGFEGECDGFDACFEFNYPIDVLLPDGTSQTANDDEELELIFENWFEQNPNDTLDPELVFPIEVTLEDGTIQSLNSEEELEILLEECFGGWDDCDDPNCDDEFDLCFEFVYPIDVILPDGTTQTANDDETLETIIFDYYDQNPNDTLLPTFNYPIDVILEDSTIQSVGNDDELEALLEACEEDEFDDCFTINYPITVIFPDGTTSVAADDESLETTIDDWYTQNPQSMNFPTFEYPISVTLDDGTTQEVNSDDELDILFEDCYGFKGDDTDKLIIGGGNGATTKAVLKGSK